jgi:predicted nucleic acid-binding protein
VARLLVDTGFLVALGRAADPLHKAASACFRAEPGPYVTVLPVLTETCFFLQPQAKLSLLALAQSGRLQVADLPSAAFPDLGRIVAKYSDRDIDLADAALVWLANETGLREILTTDLKDFAVYRLKGNRRFEIVRWFQ